MAKMKDTEIRAKAMAIALEALKDGTFYEKAEAAGKQALAYPTEMDINGDGEPTEVWVRFGISVPHWKPYNSRGEIHEAYNPFEEEEAWQFELKGRKARPEKAKANKEKIIAKQKRLKEKAES